MVTAAQNNLREGIGYSLPGPTLVTPLAPNMFFHSFTPNGIKTKVHI